MIILKENWKMQRSEVSLVERIVAAASYLTMGLVGFIWFLINYFVVKKEMSNFLRLNLFQSFIIAILFAVLSLIYQTVVGILFVIPFLGKIIYYMHIMVFATPVFNTLTLINYIVLGILIYLSIFAFLGTLPFIPYITNTVKKYQ